jgi:hypothetical protein
VPFLGTWPALQEIVVNNPEESRRTGDANELHPPYFLDCICTGPLFLTNLNKPLGRFGPALKEVHIGGDQIEDKTLEQLAKANVSALETLGLHLDSRCPLPLLLEALSTAICPSLHSLELRIHSVEEEPTVVVTESDLGSLLENLPGIRSLALVVEGPYSLPSVPIRPSLARSLRSLTLNLTRQDEQTMPAFDLSPVLSCEALESLTLHGFGHFNLDVLGPEVMTIIEKCRELKSLVLKLWSGDTKQTQAECAGFLQQIARATSSALIELQICTLPYIAPTRNLLAPFQPFSKTVKKLACHYKLSGAGTDFLLSGWDCLEELILDFDSTPLNESQPAKLTVACPSLRSIRLTSVFYVDLDFVGVHQHLTTMDLQIALIEQLFEFPTTQEEFAAAAAAERRIRKNSLEYFVRLTKIIRSLGTVSNLTLAANFCAVFYRDRRFLEALASISSLRVLSIKTIAPTWYTIVGAIFDEFLACRGLLRELRVPQPIHHPLVDFYERFYIHEELTQRGIRGKELNPDEGIVCLCMMASFVCDQLYDPKLADNERL